MQPAAPPRSQEAKPARRPRDDEIDSFGLTHVGHLRESNQDHFLISSLRQRLVVRQSSLPNFEQLPVSDDRVASIMMVADGVGGGKKGENASKLALEELTQYITESVRSYYRAETTDGDFVRALEESALRTHEAVVARGETDEESSGMATTLTLFMVVWPWTYVLQVGDSRYYQYRQGTLTQISRDQTMAQELLDSGVFAVAVANKSPLANVLSSSIGGPHTTPIVKRLPTSWGTVHLLCSDGLTKHVTDAQIAKRLGSMTSAKQACEVLVQDALDGGGTDNVTVVVARAVAKD